MTFEMYNYSSNPTAPPSDSPDYWSDRLNAIMMTYAVMANNFYFNAMANGEVNKGGSEQGMNGSNQVWLILSTNPLISMVTQTQIDGVGNGDVNSTRESSYLAVRYLHEELKTQESVHPRA